MYGDVQITTGYAVRRQPGRSAWDPGLCEPASRPGCLCRYALRIERHAVSHHPVGMLPVGVSIAGLESEVSKSIAAAPREWIRSPRARAVASR